MLTKRIIPCLDVHAGRVVKGVNFVNLKDVGDPVELGQRYAEQGADELCFLDITATHEARATLKDMVRAVALGLNIPFTVGGGIRTLEDAAIILDAGADKIAVNSAAVRRPDLLNEISQHFGSQFLVLAVDAKQVEGHWQVFLSGGRESTERELFGWCQEAVGRGVGEILFTSMDHDGTKDGYALAATGKLAQTLPVPVIASGGAGSKAHFAEVFETAHADAALAASLFHFGELTVPNLKTYLADRGIPVRLQP